MRGTESVCRSCGAQIRWHRTERGTRMPVDAQPHRDGNIRIDENDVARVTDPGLTLLAEPLYRSHFASCPHADQHRKRR